MWDLLENKFIWAALLASMSAQVLKVLINFIVEKKVDMERLTSTGGMPSSHSAAVTAAAVCIGLSEGWGSPVFAVAAIFGSIVIYDATGVRRAAGLHAEILNELIREFSHLFDQKERPKALKTLLGHTYPQVFFGTIFGALVGLFVNYFFSLN